MVIKEVMESSNIGFTEADIVEILMSGFDTGLRSETDDKGFHIRLSDGGIKAWTLLMRDYYVGGDDEELLENEVMRFKFMGRCIHIYSKKV